MHRMRRESNQTALRCVCVCVCHRRRQRRATSVSYADSELSFKAIVRKKNSRSTRAPAHIYIYMYICIEYICNAAIAMHHSCRCSLLRNGHNPFAYCTAKRRHRVNIYSAELCASEQARLKFGGFVTESHVNSCDILRVFLGNLSVGYVDSAH